MKKNLFPLLAISFMLPALCCYGQNAAKESVPTSPLTGVWRNVRSMPAPNNALDEVQFDTANLTPTPSFKVLGKGGEFQNLYITASAAFIRDYGTYEVTSPNQYVEHLEKSINFPNKKITVLSYKFLGSKYLMLTFEVAPEALWVELWARVEPLDLASLKGNSSATTPAAPDENNQVYLAADEMPQFPGGANALRDYLATNIRYPTESFKKNIQGRVLVRFVVNSEGYIEHPEVVQGLDEHCNKEALRIVTSMPRWTPGKIRGKAVSVVYTIPFAFRFK
jgi:TonB family protein